MQDSKRRWIGRLIAIFAMFFIAYACKTTSDKQETRRMLFEKLYSESLDTLIKYDMLHYVDSAYLYAYIYFGASKIISGRGVDINSVLPMVNERRIIYQDLICTNVKIFKDSSLLFLRVTPLINDSVITCRRIEGQSFPDNIAFDYKEKIFYGFIYDEKGVMKVEKVNLVEDIIIDT